MEDKKKQQKKTREKQFMNRNVTQFKHFMKHSYITENDLTWVINLRDNQTPSNLKPTESHPPEVYFKKTSNFERRCVSQDQLSRRRPNQYQHMLKRRNSGVRQTSQQLHFYATLRQNKETTKLLDSDGKKFDTIPYKDRKQFPKFIKKESILKFRQICQKDKESALDGYHKQQAYSQKIVKIRNYGILQTFTKVHGRSQVSLPGLAWQMGLRGYR